jgi:glycine cleavage system aminomethyltransferase T
LSALVSLSGESLQPALRLITNDKDAKEVGWITSAVRSERLGLQIALGYLKRGYTTIGGRFEAVPIDNPQSASDLPVEVVELPFLSK